MDRWIDITKVKAAFRKFANKPKNLQIWCVTKWLSVLERLCYTQLINLIFEIRKMEFRQRNTERNKPYDKQPNLVMITLLLTNRTVRRLIDVSHTSFRVSCRTWRCCTLLCAQRLHCPSSPSDNILSPSAEL